MAGTSHVILRHSKPSHLSEAGEGKPVSNPDESIQVIVKVRPQSTHQKRAAFLRRMADPVQRQTLRPEDHEALYHASRADMATVEDFAAKHDLRVVGSDQVHRSVVLSGSMRAFSKAFGVDIRTYEHPQGAFRSNTGPAKLPKSLAAIVTAIIGLDDFPASAPHAVGRQVASSAGSDPRKVASAYDFPPGLTGKGQCIRIITLGGGFNDDDMKAYFHSLQLPVPNIRTVHIDGQTNSPAPKNEIQNVVQRTPPFSPAAVWTVETTMDVQLAGALVNDAEIVVYFTSNSAAGKLKAFEQALEDSKQQPSVISASWGSPESRLTDGYIRALDELFQQYAAYVTVCFSSGDFGAMVNGVLAVSFPASSPHVLACGGTHLDASGKNEIVWSEQVLGATLSSTGGVSAKFTATPPWQASADIPKKTGRDGRGVPDIAAKADLQDGYEIVVGGFHVAMGGTSASAPLWASLIALIGQHRGKRIPWLAPELYTKEFRSAVRDITSGNNGHFHAEPGWDACTGWGSPIGTKLLAAIGS